MNIESLYNIFKNHPQVQTDSRKLKHGEIFFALKGDNFNGNLFAANALGQGAAAVVVDEPIGIEKIQNLINILKHHLIHHTFLVLLMEMVQ